MSPVSRRPPDGPVDLHKIYPPTRDAVLDAYFHTDDRWSNLVAIKLNQLALGGGTGPSGAGGATVSDTPPANPTLGTLWWDSAGTQLYLWYVDPTLPGQWVNTTNAPAGPAGPPGPAGAAIAAVADTAPASPANGQLWWDSAGTQFYLWYVDPTGAGQWVNTTNAPAAAVATVADTAPATPVNGQLWWDSVSTQMFMWYADPTGPGQWVAVSPPPGQ
jgi:hypothetical protein